jgi:WhiB family redox-sensing transcriptional regulator
MIETDYATDWRMRGACLSADPDLFFPISSSGPALAQLAQAKRVCAGCQVTRQCLSFALETHQVHGVWGGTSPEERQALWRRRPAQGGTGPARVAARSLAVSAPAGPPRG